MNIKLTQLNSARSTWFTLTDTVERKVACFLLKITRIPLGVSFASYSFQQRSKRFLPVWSNSR